MKALITLLVFFTLLAGCDSYRPEKLPEGTALQKGTEIVTTLNRSVSVVANQSETIYLKIDVLFDRKVRDLLIEGELKAIASDATAKIIPRKLRVSAGAIPLSGIAYSKDNAGGISLDCGTPDPSACGFYEIDKGSEVLVKLTEPVDLSGVVITAVEKSNK